MNILFTVQNYYPAMSGVPVVTAYLAEGLASNGHCVTVATRAVDNCPDEEMRHGVRIVRFHMSANILKLVKGDIDSYVRFVLKNDFDAVINECTACETTDVLLPHLKEIRGAKLLHAHGAGMYYGKPFRMMKDIKHTLGNTYVYIQRSLYYKKLKKLLGAYDYLIALSEAKTARKYFDLNADPSRITVLGNAIDDMFWESKKQNRLCDYTTIKGKGYFLSVANYVAYKNQLGLLSEYYRSAHPEFDMVFIGSEKTDYYHALMRRNETLKRKYGKRNVHFLTNVRRADIPGILAGARMYLVTSTFEEFSISIAEAMSQGIPFISVNVGNVAFLPGGIVVDHVSDMHGAMDRLCGDDEKWRQLSDAASAFAASNFHIDDKVAQMELLIKKAAGRKRKLSLPLKPEITS